MASSTGTVIFFFPVDKGLQSEDLLPLRGVAGSGFSPIAQYSPLLPPVGVWTVLSSNVAVQPLSPATDRRLGGPLPRQLSNRTQAHLCAINLWHKDHAVSMRHAVLATVSGCYSAHRGRLLTRYSPVRH